MMGHAFDLQMIQVSQYSRFAFWLSGAMVTISLICIMVFGLRLGIEFTGGTQIDIQIAPGQEISAIETAWAEALGEKGYALQPAIDGGSVQLQTQNFSAEEQVLLRESLERQSPPLTVETVTTIGPSVGAVFFERALWALGLGLLGILIFTAIAFWKVNQGVSPFLLGVAALIALVHDVILIIGVFSLFGAMFGLQVDALFITALLTVLGFSVNDSLVIFDRVRERVGQMKKQDTYKKVVDDAIAQSLRRSIHTSVSTLVVLLVLAAAFWSFGELFFFFIALALGVVIGTYSSLFLAAPLTVAWRRSFERMSDAIFPESENTWKSSQ